MEKINKLYILFIVLIIFTVSLLMLVYDMQGYSNILSLQHRSTVPSIKFGRQHESDWSLADNGFDSEVSSMSNKQNNHKGNGAGAYDNTGVQSEKRRKKKRKRKKDRQQFKNLAKEEKKIVDSDNLRKRFPNAIIIGSKKCGTRALLKQLAVHSKIVNAGPEMHFFDRKFDKGFDWYREQMPLSESDQLTIEKTPAYFVDEKTPERIYNMERKFSIYVKLIVIVRDPVKRAISDYAQGLYRALKKKKMKMRSFENKVFTSQNKKLVDRDAYIIKIGLYAEHLKRWLKYFNMSQIHFVSGEKLIARPWQELKGVQKFLNLSVEITSDHFWYNSTKKFYCIKEKDGGVKAGCMSETKGRKHPAIDQATIKALRKFYKPFNREFYKMVKRDFKWPEQ